MLSYISKKHNIQTFSICPENPSGEKGCGAMAADGTGAYAARELGKGWKISPSVTVPAGASFTLADHKGEGAVKHIWITFGGRIAARDLILRMYWDGSRSPSVEVPLGDFFASAQVSAYGDMGDNGDQSFSSLAVCLNPKNGMNCYWEMPFRTGFRMTLENRSPEEATVYYQIDCEKKGIDSDSLYFHAQFRRVNPLPYKEVYTILDNISGCGQYVGTYLFWGVNNNGWWGEGEIKFYLDGDKDFPSICGTGTEDYFCGAYNFDVGGEYAEFSTPYSGLSRISKTDSIYKASRRFNLYRWHIQDPIYFKENIKVTIQALGWRSEGRYLPLKDDISSVAYWYSDTVSDAYPPLPDRDDLEII